MPVSETDKCKGAEDTSVYGGGGGIILRIG